MRSLALAVLLLPSLLHAEPRRYTVLIGPRPAGEATLRVAGNVRDVDLVQRDRSLVTEVHEHIVVDGDGTARELRVSGHDGAGHAVDDKFTRGAQRGMYLSQAGTPEEYAVLARALLRSGGTLPLLPAGTATLATGATVTLGAGGHTRIVTAYEVGGIDLQPFTIWLDEDRELFAAGSMILRGWEATAGALDAAETKREGVRQAELAAKLTRVPAHAVAFEHARLFVAESRTLAPDMTVLVDGERITAVGRDGTVAIPRDAERIDVHGRALLPGLWDLHAHAEARDGILLLAAGVTTVRLMGAPRLATEQPFGDGKVLGPRAIFVGVLDGPGPNASATPLIVGDEAAVRKAVDRLAAAGYAQAKVYNSFKRALVPAFVDEAHKRGLRASGHVPDGMKALDLVRAGVDELQHAYMVLLQFCSEPPLVEQTPLTRWKAFAEQAGKIDFASPAVRAFVAELVAHRVDVDLTLVSGEGQLMARAGKPSPVYAAVAARLPAQAARMLEGGGLAEAPAAFAATLKLARVLHDAGVPLAFGTDEHLYGFSAERELELYVQAGIPARDALYLATLGAARIMRRDGELGSIAPGKLADMVVVDGDPLASISAVRRPTLVCKGGRLYDPLALWRAVGIAAY